jgi:ABC-2 type transport system ATP-binding protein
MTPTISATALGRRYRGQTALEDVSLAVEPDSVTGLLGRNGAGKTTLMRIVAGLEFPTSGTVRVFGKAPAENEAVLRRMVFVREEQAYADLRVGHAIQVASWFYPNWNEELARQLFYDRLLADFAEYPRTVVLSTHLIDEVADLLEHVVMLDHGRVVLDAPADDIRGTAMTVSGPATAVEEFVAGRAVWHRQRLGSRASVTLAGPLDFAAQSRARALQLSLEPLSLQQLLVHASSTADEKVSA